MSKSDDHVIAAFNKGYRVVNGDVFYKDRKLKLWLSSSGYYSFCIRHQTKRVIVIVHRLVAYQKFGDKIFIAGTQVRHKNGISTDNHWKNILIGTASQNAMDKLKSVRVSVASLASRKYDHKDIIQMHNSGKPYSFIMQQTGIKSKGTISFIINKSLENAHGKNK